MVNASHPVLSCCPVGIRTLNSDHLLPAPFTPGLRDLITHGEHRAGKTLGATLKQWVTGHGEKHPNFLALGRRWGQLWAVLSAMPQRSQKDRAPVFTMVTCLLSYPALSYLPTSFPVLPGITSQINYLPSNPCLHVSLWAPSLRHAIVSVCISQLDSGLPIDRPQIVFLWALTIWSLPNAT